MKVKLIAAAVALTAFGLGSNAFAMHQAQTDGTQSGTSAQGGYVGLNSDYTESMLASTNGTNTELNILHNRANGSLAGDKVYLGGKGQIYAQAQSMGAATNYIARTSGGFTAPVTQEATTYSQIRMPVANVLFTADWGNWVTGLVNLQVSNSLSQNAYFQDAYVVVGNLNTSNWYAFGGEKVVDFGDMTDVASFVPSLTRAAFLAHGGQVGVGYNNPNLFSHDTGLTMTLTAMDGGGVDGNAITVINGATAQNSQISNFAANLMVQGLFNTDMAYHLGAGYINGTGFNKSVSTGSTAKGIGAFDVNFGMTFYQNLQVNAEFVMTAGKVGGLNGASGLYNETNGATGPSIDPLMMLVYGTAKNGVPDLAFNGDAAVQAFSVNASYQVLPMGHTTTVYALFNLLRQDGNSDVKRSNVYQAGVGAKVKLVPAYNIYANGEYDMLSGKLANVKIPTSNMVMVGATAYF